MIHTINNHINNYDWKIVLSENIGSKYLKANNS